MVPKQTEPVYPQQARWAQAKLQPALHFLGAVPLRPEAGTESHGASRTVLPVATCFLRVDSWTPKLPGGVAPGLGAAASGRACPRRSSVSSVLLKRTMVGGRLPCWVTEADGFPLCAFGFSRPGIGRWETQAKERSIQTCASRGKRLPHCPQALDPGAAAASPETSLRLPCQLCWPPESPRPHPSQMPVPNAGLRPADLSYFNPTVNLKPLLNYTSCAP